jgi:hypothetical protein
MYILSYTSLYSCNGEWSSATRLAGLVTFLGSTVKSVAFQRKNLRRFFSSNLEPEHGKTHLLAGIGAITPKNRRRNGPLVTQLPKRHAEQNIISYRENMAKKVA